MVPAGSPPTADTVRSPGVDAGDYLYVSGQGPRRPDGSVPSTPDGQVRQALDSVRTIVEAAGLTLDHVVYVQVYLTDAARFPQMNVIYTGYFKDPRPTRTTVVVAKLVGPGNIEITVTARK